MKIKMDKLKAILKTNKKITIFLLGLSVISIITGALYITMLSKNDLLLIQETMTKFFNNITTNNLDYIGALKTSILANIVFILTIWLLGISVIGIPVIIFLFFSKIFVIGFSLSSIVATYKFKGILIALFYVFPHHLINIFTYIFLIVYAIVLSLTIIESIIKKKTIDFKPIMNKYLYVLGISVVLVIITSILEIYLSPTLIKIVLPIIK